MQLGRELAANTRNQVFDLTEDELTLLQLVGGEKYGAPFTAATLSDELKLRADEDFAGVALPSLRYAAEANYATRRRLLLALALRRPVVAEGIKDLYRFTRDINPGHFVVERVSQMATGTEMVTGDEVSRGGAARDLALFVVVGVVTRAAPGTITRAAGGQVPGNAVLFGGVGRNKPPASPSNPRGGVLPVRIGQAGVLETKIALERAGFAVRGSEITMQTAVARTRLDLFVEAPAAGGIVPGTSLRANPFQKFFVEVKTGSGRLSRNQRLAFPQIRESGGIPRGLRARQAFLNVGELNGPFDVIIIRRP